MTLAILLVSLSTSIGTWLSLYYHHTDRKKAQAKAEGINA